MRFVITSVNYSDFLAVTLPAWKKFVPSGLFVATSPDDRQTHAVADSCGVPWVATNAWTLRGEDHAGGDPTFNLGYALNVCLGLSPSLAAPPQTHEVVGHVSADCYPFGRWPADATFRSDTVYGFWRYECLTQKLLEQHIRGDVKIDRFTRLKNSHGGPIGYCQIFRHVPGRKFPSYPTAGKFDTVFTKSMPRHEMLTEAYLLHLGETNIRENWAGRVVPAWA